MAYAVPHYGGGLLGLFLRGTDPPATNQRATTLPALLLKSLSLWAKSAAGAGGKGVQGGASGRKGLREEGGRSAGEGGMNEDVTGRPCGNMETGKRMMAARRRMTAQQAHRGQGQM